MKKFLFYALLSLCAFSACKKDPKAKEPSEKPGPNPNPGGGNDGDIFPAVGDLYLFGKKYQMSKQTYMLWAEDTGKELSTNYDLDKSAIEGLIIQTKSGTKSVNFFGSQILSQFKQRIAYYGKKDYTILADKLKVPIDPNFTERFVAHVAYHSTTYLLANSSSVSTLADKRYYYKINSAGEPSFHELLPNHEYKFIAASDAGVTLSHHEVKLLWTDLHLYRENAYLGAFRVEAPNYSFINPLDMNMIDDNNAIFLCAARNDLSGLSEIAIVVVDLRTKVVKSFSLPEDYGYSAGTMTIKGNAVLIPGYLPDDKTASYYKLDFENGLPINLNKVELETNGTAIYAPGKIYTSGNNTYVLGRENNQLCYWKNGKIVRLKTGQEPNHFIYDMKI